MRCNWKALAASVEASLSRAESEASIAYIEQRVIPAGETIAWGGVGRSFDEPVVLAFVDLQPALNWTHRARCVVLDVEGRILRRIAVQQPPFLRGVSPHLRLVHRGDDAPEWAAVTDRRIDERPASV